MKPVFQTLTSSWNEIKQNGEVGIGESSGCWIKWSGKSSEEWHSGQDWMAEKQPVIQRAGVTSWLFSHSWLVPVLLSLIPQRHYKWELSLPDSQLRPDLWKHQPGLSLMKPGAGPGFHDLESIFAQEHPRSIWVPVLSSARVGDLHRDPPTPPDLHDGWLLKHQFFQSRKIFTLAVYFAISKLSLLSIQILFFPCPLKGTEHKSRKQGN